MYGIKSGTKYSESVREFCFALHYHSPAAYNVVRNQFDKNLPHPKVLEQWSRNSDANGEPGIHEEHFKQLKKIVDELAKRGEFALCSISLDEMYIQKQVYFDPNSFDYVGYPTYPPSAQYQFKEYIDANDTAAMETVETDKNSDKKQKFPVATRALVFLLTGINKKFSFPIAYHFTNGLDAENLAALVKEIIIKVSEQGVKICNLTFDGAKENIAMSTHLGANLNALSDDFSPFISNPYDQSIIYLIFDPSHMEKLMRNLIGNHEVLYNEKDEEIKWSYFVDLQNVSTHGNLLTHKLTRKHTHEFKRNKMNVRLAVETFSSSTRNSIALLRHAKHEKFEHSEPTEEFIDIMDKTFDIFNTQRSVHSNPYKRALNSENKRIVFDFSNKAKNYLKSLKMIQFRTKKGKKIEEKCLVLQTTSKTPVLGFIVNIHNLQRIYETYVENTQITPNGMKYLRTYTMSQDHLELKFAKIRSKNGHNNNPNIVHFKGAYRKISANLSIKAPEHSNCMFLDDSDDSYDSYQVTNDLPKSNIFSVSSRISPRATIDIMSDSTFQRDLQEFDETVGGSESELISDLQAMNENEHMIDNFSNISIAYAASIIEQRLKSRPIYCKCCSDVFLANEKLKDCSIGFISQNIPCASTYNI